MNIIPAEVAAMGGQARAPGEGGCNWHSCHQLAALAVRQHPSECRHGIVATTVAVTVTVAITVVVVVAIVIVIIIMIIVVAVAVVLVLLMKQQQRQQQQAEQQKRVNHRSKS